MNKKIGLSLESACAIVIGMVQFENDMRWGKFCEMLHHFLKHPLVECCKGA